MASFVLALIATGNDAKAHGGHDERLKVIRAGDNLVLELHLAASELGAFDGDGDGILSSVEFRHSSEAIKAWITDNVRLRIATGAQLKPVFFDIPVSEADSSSAERAVKSMRLIQHYTVPVSGALALGITLFPGGEKKVLLMQNGMHSRRNIEAKNIQILLE